MVGGELVFFTEVHCHATIYPSRLSFTGPMGDGCHFFHERNVAQKGTAIMERR